MNCSSFQRLGLSLVFMLIAVAGVSPPDLVRAQSLEYVVFEVSGPVENISPGTVLKEGDLLKLPENGEIKLLSKTGEVLALAGPLEGTITNEGEASQSAVKGSNALAIISKLVFKDEDLVNTLGAARSLSVEESKSSAAEEPDRSPWIPFLTEGGDYCLHMDEARIGRPASKSAVSFSTIVEGSNLNSSTWPAGSETVAVGELIEPEADQVKVLLNDSSDVYILHIQREKELSITEQIGWMAERGCSKQAMKLLSDAAKSASSL